MTPKDEDTKAGFHKIRTVNPSKDGNPVELPVHTFTEHDTQPETKKLKSRLLR